MTRHGRKIVKRYRAHRDENENPMLDQLHAIFGRELHSFLIDIVDACFGYQGRNILMEIKADKGKLKASQIAFLVPWPGEAYAVNNIEDAANAIKGTLDIPPAQYALGWYSGEHGDMFHEITARKYLLGEWLYEVDGKRYEREKRLNLRRF